MLEQSKRGASIVGVAVKLGNGEAWTIAPRPLVGPIAEAILAALGTADAAVMRGVKARSRMGIELRAFATAAEKAGEEPDLAAREALDAQLAACHDEIRAAEREACEANLTAIHYAMQRNYPGLTRDECANLLTVSHIAPCLSIIRGERGLADLFGEGDKKPHPTRPS